MSSTTTMGALDERRGTNDGGGRRSTTAAVLAMAAGLVGAGIAVLQLVVKPAVPATDLSYPFDHVTATVVQIVLFLHHLAVVPAVLVVARLAAPGRAGRVGGRIAAAGLVLLGIEELLVIAAIAQPRDPGLADLVDDGFGVWTLLAAAGLIVVGVGVIRARRWSGWAVGLPLVIGVYMVGMMPALLAPDPLPLLALAVWSLLFTLLGVAVLSRSRSSAASR